MPHDLALRLPPRRPPSLDDEAALRALAARELRVAPEALAAVRATKLSFDARPRHRGWRLALRAWERGEPVPAGPVTTPPALDPPPPGAPRAVVVGSGPAGLYCAIELLAAGVAVTVLERGRDVRARRRAIRTILRGRAVDPDCNYCFGEGGAGTYSDGKLYARSGSRDDVRGVLETLVAHGAPPSILVGWRPHVGSNRLPAVVQALRTTILRAGGEVRFGARAEELETVPRGGRPAVAAVHVRDLESGERVRLACDAVVLATGHSALDSIAMAARAGARLTPKGFAMGVRVEHPQAWLDSRQYRGIRTKDELPPSFYELATQVDGRGVYSFCMCPGGFVVPATTDGARVVVNGMSLSRRDSPHANSGLVAAIEPEDWCGARGAGWGWPGLLRRARALGAPSLPPTDELPERPEDDPLFGVRLQLALETLAGAAGGGANRAPVQRADAVAEDRGGKPPALESSYRPGLTPCDLAGVLPPGILARLRDGLAAFDRRLPGFASEHGQLLGVETRTSSPVRVVRDAETGESPDVGGLYPCGEGAGYAGGIVSAALDGRRVGGSVARSLTRASA